MAPNKIIIVDNDPGVLYMLESALQSKYSRDFAMDIETYKEGKEALLSKSLQKATVIVTDMKMFPMDGFAFIEAARQAGCKAHIVIYSAFADTDTEIDLLTFDKSVPLTPVFHKSEYLRLLQYIVSRLTPRVPV